MKITTKGIIKCLEQLQEKDWPLTVEPYPFNKQSYSIELDYPDGTGSHQFDLLETLALDLYDKSIIIGWLESVLESKGFRLGYDLMEDVSIRGYEFADKDGHFWDYSVVLFLPRKEGELRSQKVTAYSERYASKLEAALDGVQQSFQESDEDFEFGELS